MGGRILQEDAELASNSDEALTPFKPTIDDRVRDQASIWSLDERATAIAGDRLRSLPAVEALLRSIHQYARRNGFLAALPVVWPSDWTPEIPFEIALLKQGVGEVVQPTANEFWAHDVEAIITMDGHLGGIQERGRIASSFASRHQRRGAIPLYSEKPDASGKVLYPTLLLGESDVVREVDLNALGYPMTTLTTIAAAHAYAIKNGFGTGIPTFARTAPNVIVRLPIILFPRDVVEIRSVTISDLLRQRLD
jgi:hypothetical protein